MNILDYTFDKYQNGDCVLLDAHTHMKQSEGFKSICFGLLPSGYAIDKKFESENIKIGLGFHPYAAASADVKEIDVFKAFVNDAEFIGEIGLDFSKKNIDSKAQQIHNLQAICDALASKKDKVISVHAVNSATEVIDILENTKAAKGNIVIMHWFSGTSEDLKRAIDLGYYFSVGPKMAATNKGHEYIRQIPEGKMLIETDLPWDGDEVSAEDHLNLLNDFAMQLREIKSY